MTNLLQTFFLLGSLGIAASRTCLAQAKRADLARASRPERRVPKWLV